MLSTERRRHDVHVCFGDVNYDVRSAHCRVNNKTYFFSVNTITIFISCNENIQIFTRASHSWKYWCFHYIRWQYLWYSQQKSKYPLCSQIFTLNLNLRPKIGPTYAISMVKCFVVFWGFETSIIYIQQRKTKIFSKQYYENFRKKKWTSGTFWKSASKLPTLQAFT